MQHYYLIDFENVREAGLSGADELDSSSHIYLFYTENANRLALDAIAGIDAEFRAVKVAAGRQSLDMHLISFLGYIIGRSQEECSCTIISNDKGFDGTLAFWNASGLTHCYRRGRISTAPAKAEKPAEEKEAPEKQNNKARPERRDRTKRSRNAKDNRTEKAAMPVEAAQPEVTGSEPFVEESVRNDTPAELETAEIPAAVSEELAVTAEETAVTSDSVTPAEAEPSAPRAKRTHRGGRGRGKKKAEQQASAEKTDSSEDTASPAVEKQPEPVAASESHENSPEEKKTASPNPKIAEALRAAEHGDDIIETVGKIVLSCAEKKNVKQAIYREIIRRYGQKQGLEIYGLIKKNV